MPTAATGPSARLEFRSENSSRSRARATVTAEAVMAPNDPRTAARTASAVRWRTRSSSR